MKGRRMAETLDELRHGLDPFWLKVRAERLHVRLDLVDVGVLPALVLSDDTVVERRWRRDELGRVRRDVPGSRRRRRGPLLLPLGSPVRELVSRLWLPPAVWRGVLCGFRLGLLGTRLRVLPSRFGRRTPCISRHVILGLWRLCRRVPHLTEWKGRLTTVTVFPADFFVGPKSAGVIGELRQTL